MGRRNVDKKCEIIGCTRKARKRYDFKKGGSIKLCFKCFKKIKYKLVIKEKKQVTEKE